MKLKGYTREITQVGQHDLEQFIAHHMKMSHYNIADAEELSNGVQFECTVSAEISEYDRKEVEAMRGKPYRSYGTRNILDYLCSKGRLNPGIYHIDVSW